MAAATGSLIIRQPIPDSSPVIAATSGIIPSAARAFMRFAVGELIPAAPFELAAALVIILT